MPLNYVSLRDLEHMITEKLSHSANIKREKMCLLVIRTSILSRRYGKCSLGFEFELAFYIILCVFIIIVRIVLICSGGAGRRGSGRPYTTTRFESACKGISLQ